MYEKDVPCTSLMLILAMLQKKRHFISYLLSSDNALVKNPSAYPMNKG